MDWVHLLQGLKNRLFEAKVPWTVLVISRPIHANNFMFWIDWTIIYLIHLLSKVFPSGWEDWGDPPTTIKIGLSPHVLPLFCPKNVDFVIFRQFFCHFAQIVPHKSTLFGKSFWVTAFLRECNFYVVFDDGDEKTLRRTNVCVMGQKHFLEHEVRNVFLNLC